MDDSSASLPDPYLSFDRDAWSRLRAATPMTLEEEDLTELRGLNEHLSIDEVEHVYLPLTRLLNLHVAAGSSLFQASDDFLGHRQKPVPYILGVAGSVAVGKSTTSRILQALLRRLPSRPRVDLVTTDGFLFPNRILKARGLMKRKGFPESYDLGALLRFLAAVKSGADEVRAPLYSHRIYDIVPDEAVVVRRPDIMIVEGLNVLQSGTGNRLFVSDFFDFSLFVDAPPELIRQWYVDRFLSLRRTVFSDAGSYFHRYAHLSDAEAVATAERIWDEINGPNLRSNIAPTKERARLILEKGPDHAVEHVRLRRF